MSKIQLSWPIDIVFHFSTDSFHHAHYRNKSTSIELFQGAKHVLSIYIQS